MRPHIFIDNISKVLYNIDKFNTVVSGMLLCYGQGRSWRLATSQKGGDIMTKEEIMLLLMLLIGKSDDITITFNKQSVSVRIKK